MNLDAFCIEQREEAPAELSAWFWGFNGVLENDRQYRDPKESLSAATEFCEAHIAAISHLVRDNPDYHPTAEGLPACKRFGTRLHQCPAYSIASVRFDRMQSTFGAPKIWLN
jgi:hypothetical protein